MQRENCVAVIESRKLFRGPEKFTAKVTNLTPFIREDNQMETMIVSIAGMTPFQLKEAKRIFAEADTFAAEGNIEKAEELYQEAANNHLAASRRIGLDWIPEKGEIVDVELDYIPTKADPNVKALLIVGMSHRKATTATNVSFLSDDEPNLVDDPETAAVENTVTSQKVAANKVANKVEQPAGV